MTDSIHSQPSRSGRGAEKRSRLVSAARRTLHEQGIQVTTLADVASASDVPLGNVYYYFKTKDDLLAAVVENYDADYDMLRSLLERHRTPKTRLKGLVDILVAPKERIAAHGCPIGTLCSELAKRDSTDPVARAAGRVLNTLVQLAQAEFEQLGRRDARELSLTLIGAYEGAALLANALRDPDILSSQARRLSRWIDSIEPVPSA